MTWRRFVCWLHRHEPLLHMADGRIWLRCEECGYETPGWTWTARPPAPRRRILRFKKRLMA